MAQRVKRKPNPELGSMVRKVLVVALIAAIAVALMIVAYVRNTGTLPPKASPSPKPAAEMPSKGS